MAISANANKIMHMLRKGLAQGMTFCICHSDKASDLTEHIIKHMKDTDMRTETSHILDL